MDSEIHGSMPVCRDRSCWTVGFFLPVEVRSLPGPQVPGTGGTLCVVFGVSRPRPPASCRYPKQKSRSVNYGCDP